MGRCDEKHGGLVDVVAGRSSQLWVVEGDRVVLLRFVHLKLL